MKYLLCCLSAFFISNSGFAGYSSQQIEAMEQECDNNATGQGFDKIRSYYNCIRQKLASPDKPFEEVQKLIERRLNTYPSLFAESFEISMRNVMFYCDYTRDPKGDYLLIGKDMPGSKRSDDHSRLLGCLAILSGHAVQWKR